MSIRTIVLAQSAALLLAAPLFLASTPASAAPLTPQTTATQTTTTDADQSKEAADKHAVSHTATATVESNRPRTAAVLPPLCISLSFRTGFVAKTRF